MQSIWHDTVALPVFPIQQTDMKTDVLIVGGGLTGLLCAYFLKNAGIDCLVAESNTICAHTSGNTTAKITSQHGMFCSSFIEKKGKDTAEQVPRCRISVEHDLKNSGCEASWIFG